MVIEHGKIINPSTYQKLCTDEHLMFKHDGFGISLYVLKKLVEENVRLVQIIYRDGNSKPIKYLATTKQFIESDKTYDFLDNDLQHFVSRKDMLVM